MPPRALFLPLPPTVRMALDQLAVRELRDSRLQARLLVEDGLRRAGLLESPDRPSVVAESEHR